MSDQTMIEVVVVVGVVGVGFVGVVVAVGFGFGFVVGFGISEASAPPPDRPSSWSSFVRRRPFFSSFNLCCQYTTGRSRGLASYD